MCIAFGIVAGALGSNMAGGGCGTSEAADAVHRVKYPGPAGEHVASITVRDALAEWNDDCAGYGVPCEIGHFSVQGERREYVDGAVEKRYLHVPVPWGPFWNLDSGYENAQRRVRESMSPTHNLLRWVILNKDKVVTPSSARETQRNTLLGMWAVARLAGAPKVLCGFIDDDGILFRILNYDVSTIPEMAKGQWSEVIVMKFGQEMLSFIKEHVEENDERSVYLFEHMPSSRDVVCKRLTDPGSRYGFPDWFLAGFEGC